VTWRVMKFVRRLEKHGVSGPVAQARRL